MNQLIEDKVSFSKIFEPGFNCFSTYFLDHTNTHITLLVSNQTGIFQIYQEMMNRRRIKVKLQQREVSQVSQLFKQLLEIIPLKCYLTVLSGISQK